MSALPLEFYVRRLWISSLPTGCRVDLDTSVDNISCGRWVCYHGYRAVYQWCGLRPSVLGRDRSEIKKIGLGLVLCCETRSCYARRYNDLE